ncbi:MAG: SDR family oxidoreductase [Alphaproteobacteria bacterium]|nr:SDR family oxidoreductase [Alphaproteobacteria bacterium]
MTNTSSNKSTALITGASSGIGAVYADRLARRGYDLILVARNRQRLDTLSRRITAETGRNVRAVTADLATPHGVQSIEHILREDTQVSLLVNNAGLGSVAPLLDADVEKMEHMIHLNVTALTRLTYAAVPGLVRRGGGTVINIASVVAIAPERLNGVYGGSKAFVLAFSQSLDHELRDKNIRVQAVLPGATATDFWDIAGKPVHELPSDWVMSAEDMVDASLTGLDLGEVVTIPALPDGGEWDRYDTARRAMAVRLSGAIPAPRYTAARRSAAA